MQLPRAITYNAILQGNRVVYLDTDEFVAELVLSPAAARKTRLRPVIDADLVVLDDLFPSKRPPAGGAELLQSLIHQRY